MTNKTPSSNKAFTIAAICIGLGACGYYAGKATDNFRAALEVQKTNDLRDQTIFNWIDRLKTKNPEAEECVRLTYQDSLRKNESLDRFTALMMAQGNCLIDGYKMPTP